MEELLWRSLLSPVWQCRGAVIRIQLTYYCSPPPASKYQDFLLLSCELNTRDLGWAEQQIIHWLLLPLTPCEQHFLHQWFIFGSAGKAAREGFSLWHSTHQRLSSCLTGAAVWMPSKNPATLLILTLSLDLKDFGVVCLLTVPMDVKVTLIATHQYIPLPLFLTVAWVIAQILLPHPSAHRGAKPLYQTLCLQLQWLNAELGDAQVMLVGWWGLKGDVKHQQVFLGACFPWGAVYSLKHHLLLIPLQL